MSKKTTTELIAELQTLNARDPAFTTKAALVFRKIADAMEGRGLGVYLVETKARASAEELPSAEVTIGFMDVEHLNKTKPEKK